jgi:hypothetical protein
MADDIDDMYGGGPGPAQDPDMASDEAQDKGETKDEKTEEEGAGESAMLPKSILAGKTFNPGDELVLKVVAIHGDEVEVEYAKEGTEDNQRESKGGDMDDGSPRGKSYRGIGNRMMGMMGG